MTIYSFYIYDRHCNCVYSREYVPGHELGTVNKNNDSDAAKLLFGMVYSLKSLAQKLSDSDNYLRSFSTGHYRVHFLESLSNFKFLLVSDTLVDSMQLALQHLYAGIFVKNVALNALSPIEFGALKINNASFIQESDAFLKALPVFH